jgi:hypothetical protein
VRFQILVFQDVALCSLIDIDWCFRGAYCLHHHCPDGGSKLLRNVSQYTRLHSMLQKTTILRWRCLKLSLLLYLLASLVLRRKTALPFQGFYSVLSDYLWCRSILKLLCLFLHKLKKSYHIKSQSWYCFHPYIQVLSVARYVAHITEYTRILYLIWVSLEPASCKA